MSPSMMSASSSAVTSASVRMRQFCTTFAWSPEPETNPTTVWVLRTSIASSMGLAWGVEVGGVGGHVGGIGAEVELTVLLVDEYHPRRVLAGLGVLHRPVRDQDDEVAGMDQMCCRTVDSDDTGAALAGDRIRDEPVAIVDVDDGDLLPLEQVSGVHQVGVDGHRSDVVQVGVRD